MPILRSKLAEVFSDLLKGRERVVKTFESAAKRSICYREDLARGYHLRVTFSPDPFPEFTRVLGFNKTISRFLVPIPPQKIDLCSRFSQ